MDMDDSKALVIQMKDWVRDIKPELPSDDSITCLAIAMCYLRDVIVVKEDQAQPHVAFVKNGKLGVMATIFPEDDDERDDSKDQFAGMLRNLRKDCQVVCFSTEAWVCEMTPKQYQETEHLRVKDKPGRKEVAMIQLWLPERHLCVMAHINRDPLGLEPWKVYYDSATAEPGTEMKGRFK